MQVHSKGVNMELVENFLLDLERKSKGILVGFCTSLTHECCCECL